MSTRTKFICLAGILIIASFLRFYHFTSTPPGLYPDEAIDGNNAAEVAATGHYQTFYTEDNGREGLYVNVIAALFQFFHAPHEPWVVRLPAAIAGVLTVLGLYLLIAELFGSGAGLLAAFLLATCFWHINFSRIGFRAILAPLLLAWTIWLLIKAFKAAKGSAAAWWYAIVAGIVYAAGFYTYIAYRVTPLLLLLFIPFYKKYPDFWKRALVFVVAAFIVAAPIGWYFVKHPSDFFGRTSQIAVTNAGNPIGDFALNTVKTLGMFNFHGDDNWRHNVSGAPELFFPVGIIFIIGVILALSWLWKHWREHVRHDGTTLGTPSLFGLLILFVWFILALLPAALSDEGIPHSLRSILMLPPAIVFAAFGGIWCYGFMKKHWGVSAAVTIAAVFFASTAAFAYVDYFVTWAQNPNVPGSFNADYVTIGRAINALPVSEPKYVIVSAGGVPIRGIPTPVETTMFITDSFTTSTQTAKNIHYLLPTQENQIPSSTPGTDIFVIN